MGKQKLTSLGSIKPSTKKKLQDLKKSLKLHSIEEVLLHLIEGKKNA